VTTKSGAIVVGVGDELLAGRIDDTNARLLSVVLRRAGYPVLRREVVGDDPDAIAVVVGRARADAAVVVVTGGLGPTGDDLTRFGIAKAFGAALRRDATAEATLRDAYARRGRPLPPGSLVQADIPEGFAAAPNARGTAPGLLRAADDGVLLAAPGVPAELEGMLDEILLPILATRPERGTPPKALQITTAGLAEAEIGALLSDLLIRGRDPIAGSYPKSGRVVLTLETFREGADADLALKVDAETIRDRVGSAFVGFGDLKLNEVVVRAAIEKKTTLAVAESLTGGLVSDGVVEVPGASAVFVAGIAAYKDEAKRAVLGVRAETLDAHGAVSEACAREMAEGARRLTGADVALATTGIAGPDGGSIEKPVGTTWFAIADAAGTVANRRVFLGGRAEIRAYARERAFDLLRRRFFGLPLDSAVKDGAGS
jgi:nicotinamide-nucleotide amidase